MRKLLGPIRFLWYALRGHWLRPWRSPYLRWRMETYSGIPAETIDARIFWKFLSAEKWRLLRFLAWTAEMEPYTRARDSGR